MSYITLQNHENLDLINKDIYERNIPSESMQISLPHRSVSTKYSHFPILDTTRKAMYFKTF